MMRLSPQNVKRPPPVGVLMHGRCALQGRPGICTLNHVQLFVLNEMVC